MLNQLAIGIFFITFMLIGLKIYMIQSFVDYLSLMIFTDRLYAENNMKHILAKYIRSKCDS